MSAGRRHERHRAGDKYNKERRADRHRNLCRHSANKEQAHFILVPCWNMKPQTGTDTQPVVLLLSQTEAVKPPEPTGNRT